MKLNILFSKFAFLKVEFDILKPVIGICSNVEGDMNKHLLMWEVDSEDIEEKLFNYFHEKVILDLMIIRTKKGYHFYHPSVWTKNAYFSMLFELVQNDLCDADFFFYSWKRGFSTLRISGKDLKVLKESYNQEKLFKIMRLCPIIKYHKRRYDWMSINIGKKEWFNLRNRIK